MNNSSDFASSMTSWRLLITRYSSTFTCCSSGKPPILFGNKKSAFQIGHWGQCGECPFVKRPNEQKPLMVVWICLIMVWWLPTIIPSSRWNWLIDDSTIIEIVDIYILTEIYLTEHEVAILTNLQLTDWYAVSITMMYSHPWNSWHLYIGRYVRHWLTDTKPPSFWFTEPCTAVNLQTSTSIEIYLLFSVLEFAPTTFSWQNSQKEGYFGTIWATSSLPPVLSHQLPLFCIRCLPTCTPISFPCPAPWLPSALWHF